MNANEWLLKATKELNESGIGTARLDSLVLLEDATGKDRGWLLAHKEYVLSYQELRKLGKQIAQRLQHIPLSYVRGKSEFYGREFMINTYVLEPRPESETLIEVLKGLDLPSKPYIADIGTGSGALAITAKIEIPHATVMAVDIDRKCLEVARTNAKTLGASLRFYNGDLLKPLTKNPDVLLCNLPYVPDSHTINSAAMFEPPIAIFGGQDGLDLYRKLFKQVSLSKEKPQYILTESLPFQHETLATIADENGFDLTCTDDFIQVFSVR